MAGLTTTAQGITASLASAAWCGCPQMQLIVRAPSFSFSRKTAAVECARKCGDGGPPQCRTGRGRVCVQASQSTPPSKVNSLLCSNCTGNGAVVCSQCEGNGLNSVDHFDGRFKAGTTCWLCRGKRQMLCGNCNGAGFMGGFMNTKDD